MYELLVEGYSSRQDNPTCIAVNSSSAHLDDVVCIIILMMLVLGLEVLGLGLLVYALGRGGVVAVVHVMVIVLIVLEILHLNF